MKYGIVKVAACTPTVKVNNPAHNAEIGERRVGKEC